MVIVIIGLLAGYVAPRYFSQVGKSEIQVARAQIDALEKALDQYRLDTGATRPPRRAWRRWEAGRAEDRALPEEGGAERSRGAGRTCTARPGQKGEFELFSFGRDGKPGGVGEDADIGIQ